MLDVLLCACVYMLLSQTVALVKINFELSSSLNLTTLFLNSFYVILKTTLLNSNSVLLTIFDL